MIQLLWRACCTFKSVLKRQKDSNEICILLHLKGLRFLGVWRLETDKQSLWLRIYNRLVTLILYIFAFTATCDLYASISNIEIFMESVCILMGIYLILFKVIRFQQLYSEIQNTINFFNDRSKATYRNGDKHTKELHRKYFLSDMALVLSFFFLGMVLFVAVAFQPIFSFSFALPFRAKFPFSTEVGSNGYIIAFSFQAICCLFIINVIIFVDGISMGLINQLCLHLDVLCNNFRELGKDPKRNMVADLGKLVQEHQVIIQLADHLNAMEHSMFVAQVISGMSIFCLTGLEITLTRDLSTRIKFATYMFASFLHMFEWCWYGSKINQSSTKLAEAAAQSNWLPGSKQFRNDLQLVILRAQKPLVFKASPFYDFNFESLLRILRASYSYFTLLSILTEEE